MRDATAGLQFADDTDLLDYRATAYIQLAEYTEAGKDADRLFRELPNDPRGLTARAVVRAVRGDRQGARADVLRARPSFLRSGDKMELAWINLVPRT